jgi:imidazole glycerol-phosphate synthase subunit HisH
MIAIVDYGMGNLRSIAKAFEHVGADAVVTSSARDLQEADRIVLPGVGAFGEAIANLRSTGLVETLGEEVFRGGKPFLGICLGMELLATDSIEHGRHKGLGWIDGTCIPLQPNGVRVPHTGWNNIDLANAASKPLGRVSNGEDFYFNHTYHFVPADESTVAAWCTHGTRVAAAVAVGNVFATQFHPEKSQQAGLELIADFAAWAPESAPQAIRTSTP